MRRARFLLLCFVASFLLLGLTERKTGVIDRISLSIDLIQLLFCDVDEKAIETAHARIALLLTGGLARRQIIMPDHSVVPTVARVTTTPADAII
mmetsp:Transcript_41539/g.54697  ORF Transcript_41539/g.54697 Transcript_41539/m.54697 type:complete len:94 (+) Transcript_41539:1201-1482(+)